MNRTVVRESADILNGALTESITQLAREASIEINVQDARHLEASRAYLAPGKTIYVSHLPRQSWQQTTVACQAVRAAGFEPVPHIAVRLLPDALAFDQLLADLVRSAQVKEVLLVAGDYPESAGPYTEVLDALRSGLLQSNGLRRVSVAGHPEGHPQVILEEIQRAERDKALFAAQVGLQLTFLTQFFFESAPFLGWVSDMRSRGITARLVGGLAGPTKLTTLLKYALRCGAGSSMRVLKSTPAVFSKLLSDHGPEDVVRGLAQARSDGTSDFSGIHLFCFGGYLRTCEWLHAVAAGRFVLNDSDAFTVVR
jgi:methylenetetrahydrofolate reductase (NADPH)